MNNNPFFFTLWSVKLFNLLSLELLILRNRIPKVWITNLVIQLTWTPSGRGFSRLLICLLIFFISITKMSPAVLNRNYCLFQFLQPFNVLFVILIFALDAFQNIWLVLSGIIFVSVHSTFFLKRSPSDILWINYSGGLFFGRVLPSLLSLHRDMVTYLQCLLSGPFLQHYTPILLVCSSLSYFDLT